MKNMFNIYYINNEKASEISMLYDNEIVEKITRIKNTEFIADGKGGAKTDGIPNIPLIGQYLPSATFDANLARSKSNRVEDTVKVVSSKSTILRPIYEKAKEVRRLDDTKIGNLVKIKDVFLTVSNADDVMASKALMSGIINQVPVDGFGNMNFTSLIEVLLKDSAYVLCGKLPHRFRAEESIMLKIPMSAENEMESQYTISDIEIGQVTVLGIYRGKFKKTDIEVKINRLKGLNSKMGTHSTASNEHDVGLDIEDGIDEVAKQQITEDSKDFVHYIDVIAIIQDINV